MKYEDVQDYEFKVRKDIQNFKQDIVRYRELVNLLIFYAIKYSDIDYEINYTNIIEVYSYDRVKHNIFDTHKHVARMYNTVMSVLDTMNRIENIIVYDCLYSIYISFDSDIHNMHQYVKNTDIHRSVLEKLIEDEMNILFRDEDYELMLIKSKKNSQSNKNINRIINKKILKDKEKYHQISLFD